MKKEEYNQILSYTGYSSDINQRVIVDLIDALSQTFKESLAEMIPSLSEDTSIEHVKIAVTLYTKNKEEAEADGYNGEFIKVESSNIDSIAYDKDNKKLLVKFKQGTVYSYEDSTEEDFKYIVEAMSVGSAFDKFKRLHTRYSRLK